MEVTITVEGPTYQALEAAMGERLAQFMGGGDLIATLQRIVPATETDTGQPFPEPNAPGGVVVLPVYRLTHVYTVEPTPPVS